ncbi:MAG: hypothetical protein EBS01_16075 [Verrucomicrobia bacterium]|nr:hypothetical protein [Verrucomicrobiota bacterium]
MVEIDHRKATLIAELEVSRGEIRNGFRSVEAQLDVPSRVRASVRKNTGLWLSLAAAGGWLLSKVFISRLARPVPEAMPAPSSSRRRIGPATRGVFPALLRLGFDFIKPVLLEWMAQSASSFLAQRPASGQKPSSDAK